LFFAPKEKDILDMIAKMKLANHHFGIEDDVAGYLGVVIKHHDDDGSIELVQMGQFNESSMLQK